MAVSESGALIAAARETYGLTQRQLANIFGVSDRMVRAVLSGEKPGLNLLDAARQLATTGTVTAVPVRRVQRVREAGGRVSARPVLSGRGTQPELRYSLESGGRAQTAVRAPARGLGREVARAAILRDLRARRGGKKGRPGVQRVSFRLRLKDGTEINLGSKGGYDPAAVARMMHDDAEDPFFWLFHQAAGIGRYETITGAADIVAVELTYF